MGPGADAGSAGKGVAEGAVLGAVSGVELAASACFVGFPCEVLAGLPCSLLGSWICTDFLLFFFDNPTVEVTGFVSQQMDESWFPIENRHRQFLGDWEEALRVCQSR